MSKRHGFDQQKICDEGGILTGRDTREVQPVVFTLVYCHPKWSKYDESEQSWNNSTIPKRLQFLLYCTGQTDFIGSNEVQNLGCSSEDYGVRRSDQISVGFFTYSFFRYHGFFGALGFVKLALRIAQHSI